MGQSFLPAHPGLRLHPPRCTQQFLPSLPILMSFSAPSSSDLTELVFHIADFSSARTLALRPGGSREQERIDWRIATECSTLLEKASSLFAGTAGQVTAKYTSRMASVVSGQTANFGNLRQGRRIAAWHTMK